MYLCSHWLLCYNMWSHMIVQYRQTCVFIALFCGHIWLYNTDKHVCWLHCFVVTYDCTIQTNMCVDCIVLWSHMIAQYRQTCVLIALFCGHIWLYNIDKHVCWLHCFVVTYDCTIQTNMCVDCIVLWSHMIVQYCAHSSTKFCLAKVANETNFPLANKNFH